MKRLWPLAMLLMGFTWPGHTERLVGDLTRAVTPRDKRDALRMLGTVELPADVVRPFLQDPDPGVRAEAAKLLHALPDPPDLINQLADESLELRIEAAHALAGRADAVAALMAYADSPLPELRAAVIDALARGPATPEVARLLARALEDRDREVVLAALRGFARHRALPLPRYVHELARGVDAQIARAASGLIAPQKWDDPLWLIALERTTYEDPIEALEATLPRGEAYAVEPLQAWLARAPAALAPRIRALIARANGDAN